MLDEVRLRIDNAGNDQLIVAQRHGLEQAVLVRVARVCERQKKSPDIGFEYDRKNVAQGHVAVMRALVVSPADMQPHPIARNGPQCLVDRADDEFDEADEVAERAVAVGRVPLKGEVRAIELQQEAMADDCLVFDPQGSAERIQIVLERVVVARSARSTR